MTPLRALLALSATVAFNAACSGAGGETPAPEAPPEAAAPQAAAAPEAAPAAATGGQTHHGTLTDDDAVWPSDGSRFDAYFVELTAGQRVEVSMTSADFDAYLTVDGEDGTLTARNDDCPGAPSGNSLDACVDFVAPAAGRYRVVANSYDNTGRGAYTLTISGAQAASAAQAAPAAAAPQAAAPEAAPAATAGSPIHHGTITDDDPVWPSGGSPFDTYFVELTAGQRVRISMDATDPETPRTLDAHLFVDREDGTAVARNDDCPGAPSGYSRDACVDFIAPTDGRYRVFASFAVRRHRGAYTLTLHGAQAVAAPQATPPEAAALQATQTAPPGSQVLAGTLIDDDAVWPSDWSRYDTYFVELTAGQRVQVSMMSTELSAYLLVDREGGAEVASSDGCVNASSYNYLNACLDFVAPADGRYRVVAKGRLAHNRGTYTLALSGAQAAAP